MKPTILCAACRRQVSEELAVRHERRRYCRSCASCLGFLASPPGRLLRRKATQARRAAQAAARAQTAFLELCWMLFRDEAEGRSSRPARILRALGLSSGHVAALVATLRARGAAAREAQDQEADRSYGAYVALHNQEPV